MAALIVLQGIHISISGGLKALRLQSKLSLIVLISQYGGTIPFGAIFALTLGQGIRGIWQGLILGAVLQTLMYLYLLSKVDWEAKAHTIHLEMKKTEETST